MLQKFNPSLFYHRVSGSWIILLFKLESVDPNSEIYQGVCWSFLKWIILKRNHICRPRRFSWSWKAFSKLTICAGLFGMVIFNLWQLSVSLYFSNYTNFMAAVCQCKQTVINPTLKMCRAEKLAVKVLFPLFAAMKTAKLWFGVDQEIISWQTVLRHTLLGRASPWKAPSRATS